MSSSERKAEFRRYLESSGVMDAIVQSLVQLYHLNERPENPLEFVKQHLGGSSGSGGEGGGCEEKDGTIEQLNKTIEELRTKLDQCEGGAPSQEGAAKSAEESKPADEQEKEEIKEVITGGDDPAADAPPADAPPADADEEKTPE